MASIKAAEEEQMQEGETIEEFEDRVLNKRAGHLNKILQSKFEENMSLQFHELTRRNIRKQVAQKFYSILVLQKVCAVNIDQGEGYGPILVTKGPKFDQQVLWKFQIFEQKNLDFFSWMSFSVGPFDVCGRSP